MSKDVIDEAKIEKIAALASLDLTPEEREQFLHQFQDILGYFEVIDAAPMQPLADHDVDEKSHLREDKAVSSPVRPDDFSPYLESGHFKVPRVIE